MKSRRRERDTKKPPKRLKYHHHRHFTAGKRRVAASEPMVTGTMRCVSGIGSGWRPPLLSDQRSSNVEEPEYSRRRPLNIQTVAADAIRLGHLRICLARTDPLP